MAFRNELQYRHSGFKEFICDDLAILCVNLVNLIGLVTSQFNITKGACTTARFFLQNFQTNYLRINLTDFHQMFTVR